jgi:hypothetical protein
VFWPAEVPNFAVWIAEGPLKADVADELVN